MRIGFILSLLLTSCVLWAQNNLSALIPMPNYIETDGSGKKYLITEKTVITFDSPSLAFDALELQQIIQKRMGFKLTLSDSQQPSKKSIQLRLDSSILEKERYCLNVSKDGIRIEGATPGAIYYGIMTLDQLLLGDLCHTLQHEVAPVHIDDAPRFGYRAMMLDPARHFLPLEDVKYFIDLMSRYKYNILQLHLTDDQGWRVEIKKHPRLTDIGAFRNPKGGKNGPDNGFYTQEQLKELVRYAQQRNVEIIPEIDIPGHTVAVLAAYPELGCTHTDTIPKIMGETLNLMLCAQNDNVYALYTDIIREIAQIFPSSRIHLGGDEAVIEQNWTQCERCQHLMKELGYTKESQLMNYFFGKILHTVRENGKEPLLWCELNNIYMPADAYLFDYPNDATLITWRYGLTPTCIKLTAQHGNKLVMAPGEYTYLDYPQWKGDLPEFNNWGMPVTSLQKSYQFDPGYGLAADEQAHILGVTGTLWGEAIQDINRATYMAFPRALALAEAGWSQMENRSWDSFKKRLFPNLDNLIRQGVFVRVPFEIVTREERSE